MSSTLSLASHLRVLPDKQLLAAMVSRGVTANGIKDFFDLAEAFLEPASLQQALTRLDRHTLAVLSAIAELTTTGGPPTAVDVASRLDAFDPDFSPDSVTERATAAAALGLLEIVDSAQADSAASDSSAAATFDLYDGVRIHLRSWPTFGLPTLAQLAEHTAPAALEPVPDVDSRFIDRLGAERAFASTTAITELLVEVEREPARELAKGGVALPDTKRLANSMSVDLPSVAVFMAVAERAGLVLREHGTYVLAELGAAWLLETSGARWRLLATAWFNSLPADIRSLLSNRTHALWGAGLRRYIDWLYPAGGEWMEERITVYTRDAEVLGITANLAPTGMGSLVLAGEMHGAQDAVTALLPTEVEQVYLQHDLSVVAPGPLTPRVDSRLRSMADTESRALASSYRISTSSVNRAMAAGETAASILEFLGSISLTGIPQPLNYLVNEAAGRYGMVRVGGRHGQTYIRSTDDHLLGTIMVDQNLSSLGLDRTDSGLTSRYSTDVVFWSLSDARYPVAAEDDNGQIIELRRQRIARSAVAASASPLESLIERLRLSGETDEAEDGQAWLIRQLDIAIKGRSALSVSVSMPNGTIVEYQLEPTSAAGGRLRGRDRKSAIERTLPLASVTAIGPAH
jgi:hypothetical protein